MNTGEGPGDEARTTLVYKYLHLWMDGTKARGSLTIPPPLDPCKPSLDHLNTRKYNTGELAFEQGRIYVRGLSPPLKCFLKSMLPFYIKVFVKGGLVPRLTLLPPKMRLFS